VTEAIGCGLQRGYVGTYRGAEFSLRLLPKVKVEIVVKDRWVDDVIRVICEAAATGQVGDGKIFVTDVLDAVRIRTGERGEEAL
jgi:nitrogen regulatory protein P-II 1